MISKPIIITGHPYAFPYYFKVFEHVSDKNEIVFALPSVWKTRAGRFKLEQKNEFKIYGLRSWSYGSGSILGGIFKGWQPAMIFLLPYLKIKYQSKILYSCSEPNLLTTLYNGLIAKLCGLKFVFFTWQNVPPEQRIKGLKLKLSNILVGLNIRLADGVICGNGKAEKIIKNFSTNIETVVCPLSGVDVEKFKPGSGGAWREELNLPAGKTVLFYGALDKRKGVEFIIKAAKIMNDPSLKFVIVGSGPLEGGLKKMAQELHIKEQFIFLPWLENDRLPSLINSSDVFVYPSVPSGGWQEQFGYAMAEAGACGVPVVATDSGSISEIVLDRKSGILVEPGNSEKLAGAIAELLSDENLRKEMGRAGREHIVNCFSHQVIAGKISSFLKQLSNGQER